MREQRESGPWRGRRPAVFGVHVKRDSSACTAFRASLNVLTPTLLTHCAMAGNYRRFFLP